MQREYDLGKRVRSTKTLFSLEVPQRTPVLLNDINKLLKPGVNPGTLDAAIKILIGTQFSCETVLYASSRVLEKPMVHLTKGMLDASNPKTTALVFPGEGSRAVKKESLEEAALLNEFRQFFIPTKRVVDNGRVVGVELEADSDIQQNFSTGQFNTVIVIDDVVATGKTLNTLREKLQSFSPIPLRFIAAAWFIRRPTDIRGYESDQSVYRYWTREGWPALNSLSTLLRLDEKGEAVREGYIKKYGKDPCGYGFRKEMDYIRSLTTLGGSP